ncbi:MAG: ABC transporter permease [Armatimonadetes bacterium]|nr:ABC transporter permease [Armatimonadota bacterium]
MNFFDLDLLNSTLRVSTPLILAALGGLLCERAGVINIALEGKLLMGAFVASWIALSTGNPWLGVAGAMTAAAILGLLHGFMTQKLRIDQIVSGVGINMLAFGGTTLLYRALIEPLERAGTGSVSAGLKGFDAGWLQSMPVLGRLLADLNWLTIIAIALPFVIHFGLYRTRWGLRVTATGNDAAKARSMGAPVLKLRYLGVVYAGLLTGLAGAFLTVGSVPQFRENMSAGRGFIALAALIFGRWTPMGAAGAALGFGFFEALQLRWQVNPPFGKEIPTDLLFALPYLLTVIALIGLFGKNKPPADLGNV